METNMNAETYEELKAKGDALILAARAFWLAHRQACGPCAVVWLKDTSGHLIVFTRGEYRDQIMRNVGPIFQYEMPLEDPFVVNMEDPR